MNKKTGIIIAISVSILLFITIGLLAFLYLMTDTFKTNEQLFWKYVSNSSQLAKVLSIDNAESQKTWKDNHSYTAKGDLTISVTKETGTQEVKLGTTAKHSQSTGRTYADVTLYQGNTENLKVSYINSNDIYALYCKDIYEPYYIGFRNKNLDKLVEKFSTSEGVAINANLGKMLEEIKGITQEEKTYLSDTYSNVVIENILKEKYTKIDKTTIQINNRNYETIGYQLQLNQEDLKQLKISILTKAKEDEQTISILNKLLVNDGSVDIKNIIDKMINQIQQQAVKEMNLLICVYPVNKQLTRIQAKDNTGLELTLDIDNSKENKKSASLKLRSQQEEKIINDIQIDVEKQNLENMMICTTNIVDNLSGYQLTMNTSLGNITNDKIENNSKVTILDSDTTIETSYYNTIQVATEEVDVEELADTSAVVINNYPKEQLEEFFEGLGKKIEQVLPEKIAQLNLKMTQAQDGVYYLQGIASSVLTVMNANGVPQLVGTTGATMIMELSQTINSMQGNNQIIVNPPVDSTFSQMTQQEKQLFNQKYEVYKGEEVNGTIVKTLISNIANNNTNSERIVYVKILGDKINKPDGWNEKGEMDNTKLLQLSNEIQMANKYKVSIEYNEEGFVNHVAIMEKE